MNYKAFFKAQSLFLDEPSISNELYRGSGSVSLAVITKHHRPNSLNNRQLFPDCSGSWRSKVKVPGREVFRRPLCLTCRWPPSGLCTHLASSVWVCVRRWGKRGSNLSGVSFYKGTNSIRLVLHLTLITSQRPHLQVPSYWGLGLQRRNLGVIQTFSS